VIRFVRFNVVGALGIGVQLAVVAVLVHALGVHPMLATAAGVCAAVAHNFGWHVRWTWRDRITSTMSIPATFVRFAGANGLISLIGSVVLIPAVTGVMHVPVVPANLITIAVCGVLNFWAGGRVFGNDLGSRFRKSISGIISKRRLLEMIPEIDLRIRLPRSFYISRDVRAGTSAFGGSGVKSSPGLMKRSRSKLYCLSYSWRYRPPRARSASCVPRSTISPPSITRI